MKKVSILSFFCVFHFQGLIAQITVKWWDFLGPSEVVTLGSTNFASITHSSPGPNKTWNYSSLQDNFTRTFSYGPAQWSAASTFFPSAMYVSIIDEEQTFLNVTDAGFDIHGFYADPFFSGNFAAYPLEPVKREIAFPMTYGQTWENYSVEKSTDYEVLNADSLVYTISTYRRAHVDAWGTITTPLGSFQALRLHTNDSILTNSKIYSNGVLQSNETVFSRQHQYSFYSNNPNTKYHIVKYTYEPELNQLFKVQWQKSTPTLSSNSTANDNEITVFPNPAKNSFTVNNLNIGDRVQFINANGQIITQIICSTQELTFNEHCISPGMYFIKITTNESTITKKVVLQP